MIRNKKLMEFKKKRLQLKQSKGGLAEAGTRVFEITAGLAQVSGVDGWTQV